MTGSSCRMGTISRCPKGSRRPTSARRSPARQACRWAPRMTALHRRSGPPLDRHDRRCVVGVLGGQVGTESSIALRKLRPRARADRAFEVRHLPRRRTRRRSTPGSPPMSSGTRGGGRGRRRCPTVPGCLRSVAGDGSVRTRTLRRPQSMPVRPDGLADSRLLDRKPTSPCRGTGSRGGPLTVCANDGHPASVLFLVGISTAPAAGRRYGLLAVGTGLLIFGACCILPLPPAP
jgi:hypothetical protein